MKIDISVVLNLHNEANYLIRTLMSLEEASDYARRMGLGVELVVVLDNASKETIEIALKYNPVFFDNYKYIFVDNRSLGLSRNSGVSVASGDYIATADGDDLVSFNFFWEAYEKARQNPANVVVVPEYVFAFGSTSHFQQYFDSKDIPIIGMAGGNSYTSRILCNKEIFKRIPYVDARFGLLAFEDYHFNCEALASGILFEKADDTVLFYRQRANSIMTGANGKIIPPTKYFKPEVFLRLCADDYKKYVDVNWVDVEPLYKRRQRYLNSSTLDALFLAANKIDQMIDISALNHVALGVNSAVPLSFGASYYEACEIVGNASFTDVVLLPFVSKGGGEKYICQILKAIQEIDENSKILILCGEKISSHEGMHLVPDNSMVVDLYDICSKRNLDDIYKVALRLIQSTSETARMHVKGSHFATGFINWCGSELKNNKIIYYYFCDYEYYSGFGSKFIYGANYNFISDHLNSLSCVVSDNSHTLELAKRTLNFNVLPNKVIYAHCEVNKNKLGRNIGRRFSRKILWASRLDQQKRPDRLKKIAEEIFKIDPLVKIHVYGTGVFEGNESSFFSGSDNIIYCGPFSDFRELQTECFDVFLYTSDFDGLPNIVLEAISESLLVIAPDVSGIPEIIDEKTGFIIKTDCDEQELVNRYVNAVVELYAGNIDVCALVDGAIAKIIKQHSYDAYLKNVNLLIELDM